MTFWILLGLAVAVIVAGLGFWVGVIYIASKLFRIWD